VYLLFYLQQACVSLNIDIITLDMSGKLDFKLKRSYLFVVSLIIYHLIPVMFHVTWIEATV